MVAIVETARNVREHKMTWTRGIFRLWIVGAIVTVFALANLDFDHDHKFWFDRDVAALGRCYDPEQRPEGETIAACRKREGTDQTMFQHEQTTPARYWGNHVGLYTVFVLAFSLLGYLVFLVVRWIVRGFLRSE